MHFPEILAWTITLAVMIVWSLLAMWRWDGE
jgi:hypothetical protein